MENELNPVSLDTLCAALCAVMGIGLYIHAENRYNSGNSAP